jgi:hypothetical protein
MKTLLSFIVACVICGAYFLTIDWALQKAQGLYFFAPDKKVEATVK